MEEEPILLALKIPKPSYPCKCGHGVFDHGSDPKDTGCTECPCPKFVDA